MKKLLLLIEKVAMTSFSTITTLNICNGKYSTKILLFQSCRELSARSSSDSATTLEYSEEILKPYSIGKIKTEMQTSII